MIPTPSAQPDDESSSDLSSEKLTFEEVPGIDVVDGELVPRTRGTRRP